MESKATMAIEKMNTFLTLSALLLILTGCDDNALAIAALPNEGRTIATTYKIKTTGDNQKVACYRINADGLSTVRLLGGNQFVKIAAVEDGLRRFNGELWLNIYPPLSHRPTCYVNVNNLIPYS